MKNSGKGGVLDIAFVQEPASFPPRKWTGIVETLRLPPFPLMTTLDVSSSASVGLAPRPGLWSDQLTPLVVYGLGETVGIKDHWLRSYSSAFTGPANYEVLNYHFYCRYVSGISSGHRRTPI